MSTDWWPKLLVPVVIVLTLQLIRKLAPAPKAVETEAGEGRGQTSELLPPGVAGAFMCLVGLLLALSFFLLRWANHQWAAMDGPAELRLYEVPVIWCLLPGFAALSIPWPFTIWLLRKLGRSEDAYLIATDSNRRAGMNSFSIMKWLTIGITGPIAVVTVLAIPMHVSITNTEIIVGHFAQLHAERFQLSQARRATLVEGIRYRDRSFHAQRDLLLDFVDGRRFHANVEGDGGTSVPFEVVHLLLAKTGLPLEHAQTEVDIPPIRALE
jgi:hypothetical protein